jgi:LmbE family N-acetylglucosaminyl deacetylase
MQHLNSRLAAAAALATVVSLATAADVPAASKHTILVVLTHGDDDVSIAPLIARYASEGQTVFYATFTGPQDPSGVEHSPARQELLCASKAMGVKDTFVNAPPNGQGMESTRDILAFERRTAERLIDLINRLKPDVIITWGPDGLTGHPLHITVGTVVTRVFQEQQLFAYKPRKLYYIAYPASRFPNHAVFGSISEKLTGVSGGFITTRIDGSRFLQQTRDAIACHTTPRGGFSSNSEWQQAWIDNVITTLGGRAFLRLVFPVGGSSEADILKGL